MAGKAEADKKLLPVCSDVQLIDSKQALLEHYAAFIFRYAASSFEHKKKIEPEVLAHFIMIVCAVPKSDLEILVDDKKTTVGALFNKCGGFDYVAALDPTYDPEYPIRTATEILTEGIANRWISEKEIRDVLDAITLKDPNLLMLWDVSLQNMAKAKGEFKTRLKKALESKDLERLPKEIAELNKERAREFLEEYGREKRCPNCGWGMRYLGGISTLTSCGDEDDRRYYQCDNDSKYFVDRMYDKFLSDELEFEVYEISKEEAEADLKAIKNCPDQNNKHCGCETHSKYRFH